MKTLRQLFRQPIKTLSGILLVTLAVAILCVCLGQAMAANNMAASLDDSYTTVALLTGKYQYKEERDGTLKVSTALPEEVAAGVEELISSNSDIVLEDSYAGLASAYIPELTPDNFTNYFVAPAVAESLNYYLQNIIPGTPYSQTVLLVTLTEIDSPSLWSDDFEAVEAGTAVFEANVVIKATVDRAVSLEAGYNDPTGYTITLNLHADDQQDYWDLGLEVGQQYLVQGSDYYDLDWELRARIAQGYGIVQSGDPFQNSPPRDLAGPKIEAFNTVDWHEVHVSDSKKETMGVYNAAWYLYKYIDEEGNEQSRVVNLTNLDMEHLVRNVRLSISAGDIFPAGDESPVQTTIAEAQINYHAFPIIGVDKLRYIPAFAQKTAAITEGRDFTEAELADGAKVCVISQVLAQKNGLSVGDTITLRYYGEDNGSLAAGVGVINPAAQFYSSETGFSTDAESYIIVGLYHMDTPWGDLNENLYSFTPNTVFVPENAVTGEMESSNQGLFHSVVLKNGTMEAFEYQALKAGYNGLFECWDQGYTQVAENLHDYSGIARQAMEVGICVYLVVLLLYLLLFPTRQGKAIATMASLGAAKGEKRRHLMGSCLGILVPGTVLGVLLGIGLRQQVLDALTGSADVTLPLKLEPGALLAIAAAQLILAALLSLAVCLPMARDRSLLQKGRKRRFRLQANGWVIGGFALIVALVLCGLNAANEAEIDNYNVTRKTIPVTISIQSLTGDDADPEIDGYIADLFMGDYSFGLQQYLSEVRVLTNYPINTINGAETERMIIGMTSVNCAPELLPVTDSHIIWRDGYDETIFATDAMVCVVPDGTDLDADPSTPEQELDLYFCYNVHKFDNAGNSYYELKEYTCRLTVVGTYISSFVTDAIYCPYPVVNTVQLRMQIALNAFTTVRSVGGVLADNDRLEEFRTKAYSYFAQPDPIGGGNSILAEYALHIDDEALMKAQTVLSNSITINRISTLLVFILSAGTGFFLGFLMIRSRKREIILMRTLGKANGAIYLEFAAEQMLRVILGAAIGGAVFLWQPVERLLLFVAIYFVGLSAALLLFLHTNLLASMKEEES